MPRIGKRILKSSLAVFLCFLIYLLRNQEGIVFYSCIAAVLCMQQDTSNTQRVALNRVIGTLIGGFIGMLVLLFEKHVLLNNVPILQYALISFMIIPIIYVTVLLKKTSASYISCVVFMSVTVSHGADVNPYVFACNRMLDTLIGIAVAYVLNCVHLPYHLRKDTLYVSTLDHMLLQEDTCFSAYTKIKLRQLLEQGAAITIATSRTPATLLPILQGIPITLPVVVMNGAALYDCQKQTYFDCCIIKKSIVSDLLARIKKAGMNCFQHSIQHHILHVYYSDFQNTLEEAYYHSMRRQPYKSYVYEQDAQPKACVYLLVMDTCERVLSLYEQLLSLPYASQLHLMMQPHKEDAQFAVLEIYSIQADKKHAVARIQSMYGYHKLCVFAFHKKDLALAESADMAYTAWEGDEDLKAVCNLLKKGEQDSVIRKMDKHYHGHE